MALACIALAAWFMWTARKEAGERAALSTVGRRPVKGQDEHRAARAPDQSYESPSLIRGSVSERARLTGDVRDRNTGRSARSREAAQNSAPGRRYCCPSRDNVFLRLPKARHSEPAGRLRREDRPMKE